jgi:hypothetical protein
MINNSDVEASLKRITTNRISGFMDTFSKQIINNEASLFIGSGVSYNSGLPSWTELLEPCANDLGIELTQNTNLYDISQYYVNKHNDNSLRRIVSAQVNKITNPNVLLTALMEIGFASIWTTNYDQLVERLLTNNEIAYNAIFSDKNLPSIDKYDKVNIYKINGDISDPENMILTRSDYENYEKKYPLFLTFLKRELVANTFLFVGYGFNDFLILDCLSTINQMLGSSGNIHYALLPIENYLDTKSEHFIDDLKKRYGIECLLFKHDELSDVISALNLAVKERKVFISGAYDNVTDEVDSFADAISESLVTDLLDHEYRISTGVGKHLGTYITVYAHRYLAEKKRKNTSKYLSMRPFPFHLSLTDDVKKKYRNLMQRDCNAAIFLFGQSFTTDSNGSFEKTGHFGQGTYQEFEIARDNGLTIIPIGSSGFEAEIIWNEVKRDINRYPYLSNKIDMLGNEKNPQKLSKLVLLILDEVMRNNRIKQQQKSSLHN